MDRLEKKCMIASAGTHVLLCLILIFGSAFLLPLEKARTIPPLHVYPSKLIDDLLSGGGGSPKVTPSDGQQKGQTLLPQPPQPHLEQARLLQTTPPVQKTEVKPKPDVKKVEIPKVAKPPRDSVKRPDPKVTKPPPMELRPVSRPTVDKVKAKAEAQARETEAREAEAAQKRIAQAFNQARERLQEGFSQGTLLITPGPGGAAYANYAQFVKSVYEDAWTVADELTDESSTAKVTVTIAKSGHVLSARLERPSGNPTLDRSVQRALDKVRFIAPFPEGATDQQRTFLINFNLKAKHLLG